jgi:protein-S-isoprenylcysteine O-methyltransferase Ste14
MRSLELKIPPPLVALACGVLMWILARATPHAAWPLAGRGILALALAALGVCISAIGVATFHRTGTTSNPMRPGNATTLVTGGIYRRTRNPMYLGLSIVLLGWGVYLANALTLLILPGFVLYITRFQIVPEERALSALFGTQYKAYQARVRRWL